MNDTSIMVFFILNNIFTKSLSVKYTSAFVACGQGSTNRIPIPQQIKPRIIHPRKDKSNMNRSAFCQVVICLDTVSFRNQDWM